MRVEIPLYEFETTIPEGYVYDGATYIISFWNYTFSVLNLLNIFGLNTGTIHSDVTIAFHDWIYENKGFEVVSRKYVDLHILYEMLQVNLHYNKFQAWIISRSVYLGGYLFWREW